jgi:hypothetical protein
MATWKVRITGKQKAAPDVDLLLAAVMALGRQLRDEQHRRSARKTSQPQPTSIPETTNKSVPGVASPASKQEAS